MRRLLIALVLWTLIPVIADAQTTVIKPTRIHLNSACVLRTGSGTPEAAVTGVVCDTYWRTDTGQVYTKTSGTGNTGWVLVGSGIDLSAEPFWTKTASANLSAEFAMSSLATGLVKNTTTTGVPTIALAGTDYVVPTSAIDFSVGRLSVGSGAPGFTSPTRALSFDHTFSTLTTGIAGAYFKTHFTPASSFSGEAYSTRVDADFGGTQNFTGANYALYVLNGSTTTGTIAEEEAGRFVVARSGGNTTDAHVSLGYCSIATGTMTNCYGWIAQAPVIGSGGALTNWYGFTAQSNAAVSGTQRLYTANGINGSYWHIDKYAVESSGVLYDGGTLTGHEIGYSQLLNDSSTAATTGFDFYSGSFAYASSGSNTRRGAYGVAGNVQLAGSNTFTDRVTGVVGEVDFYGSGVVPAAYGFDVWLGWGATDSIADVAGMHMNTPYDISGTAPTGKVSAFDIESFEVAGLAADKNWFIRYAPSAGVMGYTATGAQVDTPGAVTIGSSGTLTPTTTLVKLTCSNGGGCTVTMGETGIVDGQTVKIVNVSANTANFADTSGVSELAGTFAMGQWDTLTLQYVTDRWVEIARSNN